MKFSEIIDQASLLLQRKGRLTYRSLKLEFDLDDEQLDVLKEELIEGQQVAHDENTKVLVWTGSASAEGTDVAKAESPTPASVEARPPVPPRPVERSLPTGERRQLTVMFCDLVGSTALSEQLDPEDLHTMIRAYQAACGQIIEQYDGTIAQYLGDGLLVYFGYPAAHEDDTRRAVRAGLDILKQIPQLPAATPLQVRIGVHTGPVVVGEIGQGGKREQLALGETPNIAARVQSQAEPNTLVISASSYRLVQGFFTCQDLGQHQLKGISIPVTLYQVQGEGAAQSSFEVSLQKGLTRLVGREEEVGLLKRRWERAVAGDGQVVLISGEAGIGKSRLLQVLREDIVQEEHWGIEAGCSPFYQNTALYPVTDQLQRLLLFGREDTATEKHRKLGNALSTVDLASAEALALLANLLSIPAIVGQVPLNLSAQKQKEKTLEVLVTWVQREAERQPVLLVVEDLHWADPSTLELLRLLIERVSATRVFVVLTFRPEFSPPWPMRGYLSTLTLSRLLHQQVEVMASRVAGGKALPKELINQLVEKTDGVPLFVEEITKSILESDALQEREGHYELVGSLADFHIPSTLQDSLMARLDRLNIAREIAQFGAVLGREFSYELLHATAGIDEVRLQHGLAQLIEAELVYIQGFPPDAQYTFKHALVQDAAYESLLKSTRREQHRRVATVLIEGFADTAGRQPELVAYHYTEAGLVAQAIPYWQEAGQRAVERSVHLEAIAHLRKGLTLVETLPDTTPHIHQELSLLTTLGPALMATKGFGASEVEETYVRARELCNEIGDAHLLFAALRGLWVFFVVRGPVPQAYALGEELLALAEREREPAFFIEAQHALGQSFFMHGEFSLSRKHCEQGIAIYDPQQHKKHATLYGSDPKVSCLFWLSVSLWYLGYPDQAVKRAEEALSFAQTLAHPVSLAYGFQCLASVHQYRGEGQAAQDKAAATIDLSAAQGLPFWLAFGTIVHGWALAKQGHNPEGIASMRQGLVDWRATGAGLWGPYYLTPLIEVYRREGRVVEETAALQDAFEEMQKTEEYIYKAELFRLQGEHLLRTGVEADESRVQSEAEACFHEALLVARQQEAKSLELRAAMSLAQLWQRQGKRTEAQKLLSAVYNWFTEGFDTQDLQDAKALLEELG